MRSHDEHTCMPGWASCTEVRSARLTLLCRSARSVECSETLTLLRLPAMWQTFQQSAEVPRSSDPQQAVRHSKRC